jgi:hypothetical protein
MNESTNQSRMVSGLFNDRESAERAYQSLNNRGYSHDEANVIMSDETRNNFYPAGSEHTSALADKTMEDAGTGAAIGGTLGAIIAGIAAIGTSVLLPGLGLVVAGPLAAALVGAGAGGLTGGLIGALVGHGVPEDHAAEYESGIKNGGVFMGVNARNDEDAEYLHNEFNRSGGSHVVGTGVGVAGGALAGAAIGSAVLPVVGTGVGAVAGGIAGGAAGHEAGEAINPKPGDQADGDHAVGTGTGAVGGAIAGATIGSVVPVAGTAVGGVVGAVGGAVAGHEVAEEVNPDDKLTR